MEKRWEMNEVKGLRLLGRVGHKGTSPALFWTASGFEAGFYGSELWCEFETDYDVYEQWIAVFVNGAFLSRQMLPKGKSKVCLVRNMQPGKEKRICVRKEVQAMPGDERACLLVHALFSDGEFYELPASDCKIEFIGDSITSGEGSYGAQEEGDWIAQWFSTTQAYPYLVARQLSADYRVFSQSGYGLCSAWDNNRNNVIPAYYEQVCGVLSGELNASLGANEPHDFSEWQPDAVVINLGTNDAEAFNQPAWTNPVTGKQYKMEREADKTPKEACMEEIAGCVEHFLECVRKNNPSAEIFWCFGMMGILTEPAIQKGIRAYMEKSGDTAVSYVPIPEISGREIGARSHPSLAGHEMAAGIIAAAIRSRMSDKSKIG